MFAGCLKVPICKVVCFRCILPTCYGCTGSDDEEGDPADEGYHSQNRRSSEILPGAEGGAEGGSERQEVEMCEMNSETVAPLIPPRTRVNDYRKDPGKPEPRGATGGASLNKNDTEVTYIEVESISLHNVDMSSKHIPDSEDNTDVKLATDYEEPVKASVVEEKLVVALEKKAMAQEYDETEELDVSDDSESQYYVNEDVLKPKDDTVVKQSFDETDSANVKHYMNLDNVAAGSDDNVPASGETEDEKPHEYINLKPLEDIDVPKEISETAEKLVELAIYEGGKSDGRSEMKNSSKSLEKLMVNLDEKIKSPDEKKGTDKAEVDGVASSKQLVDTKPLTDLAGDDRAASVNIGDTEAVICVKDSEKLVAKEKDKTGDKIEATDSHSSDDEENTSDQKKLI